MRLRSTVQLCVSNMVDIEYAASIGLGLLHMQRIADVLEPRMRSVVLV